MKKYDYLIVGSGLYGAVFARRAMDSGHKVLVLEKREHVGGNLYCKNVDGIGVHWYGAHIFHTSNRAVWDFVNSIVEFVPYINSPVANYKGELYNLPFNMNTFYQMWGVSTPQEAMAKIERQRAEHASAGEPANLEEQALKLVGRDIYEKLIRGYTEKQWGRPASELPAFIIRRLPVRLTFDNNYFNDTYQGIPRGGYNAFIDGLLCGAEVRTGVDYMADPTKWNAIADKILFTGRIDEFFGYRFGGLEYRGLRFDHQRLETENYQGVAVMNYTDAEIPYTRVIEHKHFERGNTAPHTVISREYPVAAETGAASSTQSEIHCGDCYPVNDDHNSTLYQKYAALAAELPHIRFGGRLGEYKYYDMDKVVEEVLEVFDTI